MNELECDVLVIGAGLVGATQAIALAEGGIDTCIVDLENPFSRLDKNFDGRVSAIALATTRLLKQINIWHYLEDEAAPILDIRISDGTSPLHLHFNHREISNEPFGFMVENRHLRHALLHRIKSLKKINFIAPREVTNVVSSDTTSIATLDNSQQIKAKIVIAADGHNSPTRNAAGIRVTNWAYKQAAIVCTVSHEFSHEFIAHEHFFPAGPFAILPLKNKNNKLGTKSSIVWTERSALVPTLMCLNRQKFKAEFDIRFGKFLGKTRILGPKWSYPLGLQFAETSIGNRLALVGDANHRMHPIAGQGLNMGFRDISALTEVIIDARRLGLDIGSHTVLTDYNRWRRFDNTLMLACTDGLNRLFSNNIPPIKLARGLGLAAVNKIPSLKRTFMRHAMGLAGELPRLMRGEA